MENTAEVVDTSQRPPSEGDPMRSAWIEALRAEIFGISPTHESFPADAPEIRRRARASRRRKLRRTRKI